MMRTISGAAFVAGLAMAFTPAGSGTAEGQTVNAFKCQAGASKASSKFIAAKSKCVVKCEAGARRSKNPFSDCDPPYAGPTLDCVAAPLKGAQAKAISAIVKACTKKPDSCPACYSGGDCAAQATAVVSNLEFQLDVFVPAVACEETTDKVLAKCIDGNAKALTKLSGALSKCFDKCYAAEFKGKSNGACTPGGVGDTKTLVCLDKAESKAITAVNKACFTPPKSLAPACYNDAVNPPSIIPSPSTAAGWVDLVKLAVGGVVPTTYCGSPSGAFLD